MKSCPKCYSKQDDSVVICDCGYNFEVEKDINTKRLEYDNEKDEYTFKRKFHPVLFIVFIMLILMGFSMIISGLVFTNLYSVGPFFLLVLGSVLIIYGLIFSLLSIKAKKTSLIINPDEIVMKTTFGKGKEIKMKWEHISNIHEVRVKKSLQVSPLLAMAMSKTEQEVLVKIILETRDRETMKINLDGFVSKDLLVGFVTKKAINAQKSR